MATRKKKGKGKDKDKIKDNGINGGPMPAGFAGPEWKGFSKKKDSRMPRIAVKLGRAPIATTGKLRAFHL